MVLPWLEMPPLRANTSITSNTRVYRLGDEESIEAAWQLAGKSFWNLFLLLPIWIHFFRQSRHWGTSRAYPLSWQLCSTSSAWCTHTVELSASKWLSVLAILQYLFTWARVLCCLNQFRVEETPLTGDFHQNEFIPTKAFLGNFLQTHSQHYHDAPAHCGVAICSNHNVKKPWFQGKSQVLCWPLVKKEIISLPV